MLALQTFGSPVELLSKLPEEPIDPPNGDNHDYNGDADNDDDDDNDQYEKLILQNGLGANTQMELDTRCFLFSLIIYHSISYHTSSSYNIYHISYIIII